MRRSISRKQVSNGLSFAHVISIEDRFTALTTSFLTIMECTSSGLTISSCESVPLGCQPLVDFISVENESSGMLALRSLLLLLTLDLVLLLE